MFLLVRLFLRVSWLYNVCLQATSRPSDFVDNLEFVYVQSMQRVSVDNCLSGREYGYPGFGPSKCQKLGYILEFRDT